MFDVPELRKRLTERITEDRKGILPVVITYDVDLVMEVIERWLSESIHRGEDVTTKEYITLIGFVNFNDFDYDEFVRDERVVLEPQLENLGYSGFKWENGETDSFGTLTRICTAFDKNGKTVHFLYG